MNVRIGDYMLNDFLNNIKLNNILKKESITLEEYQQLDTDMQNDDRIIDLLIKSDKNNIRVLPPKKLSSYVSKKSSLLSFLNTTQLRYVIKNMDHESLEITPDIFHNLNEEYQIYLFMKDPSLYIPFFEDKEKIYKILLEMDSRVLYQLLESNHKRYSAITKFIYQLKIEDIVLLCQKHSLLSRRLRDDIEKEVEELSRKMQVEKLIPEAGDDIGKAMRLYELDYEAFAKLCLEHPRYLLLRRMSPYRDEVCKYYLKHSDKTSQELLRLGLFDPVDENQEECFEIFPANFKRITPFPKNFEAFVQAKLERITDLEKREKLKELIHHVDYCDGKKVTSIHDNYDQRKYFYYMFFDDRIIDNNSVELLKEYYDTQDYHLFIDILTNAYGEHVREILHERKGLTEQNLSTFAMFSPVLYDVFGKNFANYCLTFGLDEKVALLVRRLEKDNHLLNHFCKYFHCVIEEDEKLDINMIYTIIDRFVDFEDILSEISYDELTDEQIENVRLLINDPYIASASVETIEDLMNYHNGRKIAFQKYINSLNDTKEIKNVIFYYLMNTYPYDGFQGDIILHNIDCLSLEEFFMIFDIDSISQNHELIQQMDLTKEEVALLLTLNEINKIKDIHVLRDTLETIFEENLDFRACHNLNKKMREYFSKDIKNGLTASKDLDKMNKTKLNGVEVVPFTEQPFRFIISHIGFDLNDKSKGFGYGKLYGNALLNNWLYRENLSKNYISTSLVSSNTKLLPTDDATKKVYQYDEDGYVQTGNNVIFIFDNNVDIVGMGTTDIAVSDLNIHHAFRYLDTKNKQGEIVNNFEFTTMEKLEEAINNQRDNGKFSNEIALARYQEDIRREDSNTRVMPIGMYVVGKITPEILNTAKVFNKYYQEHHLGKFRIIQVDPRVYQGKGIIRPDMATINTVVEEEREASEEKARRAKR